MEPAIKFEHFVKTDQWTTIERWLITRCKGNYVQDTGVWRDRGIVQERGIEFEQLADAKRFILSNRGTLQQRKIQ